MEHLQNKKQERLDRLTTGPVDVYIPLRQAHIRKFIFTKTQPVELLFLVLLVFGRSDTMAVIRPISRVHTGPSCPDITRSCLCCAHSGPHRLDIVRAGTARAPSRFPRISHVQHAIYFETSICLATYKRRQKKYLKHASETLARIPENT
jgi:hypothetical protein